ncbi:flagellar biosynthesis protein [Boseongicola sp. H5]|uniref:flagellar biosynthesis protein n=1 Tax=Boseongicola sp. H5 TaxID=2763261 RepID=UPI001D0A4D42|nr:flagellar biosynthesis protein [Boseongicola sp. H5]
MSARRLDLEEFGQPPAPESVAPASVHHDLEAIKLDAFESGYRDGWDDCLSAEQQGRAQIGADLSRNLKDLSFTYLEARNDVLKGLQALLDGIIERLVPEVAAAAMVPMVRAELASILGTLPDETCEILASPAACPALEALVAEHAEAEIRIVPEPAYFEGHVTLRFGAELREIDLGAATERIAQAIRDFTLNSDDDLPQQHERSA